MERGFTTQRCLGTIANRIATTRCCMMKSYLTKFLQDDDGAITVDFVVLTAAICTLGLIVVLLFSGSTTGLANEIQTALNNINV